MHKIYATDYKVIRHHSPARLWIAAAQLLPCLLAGAGLNLASDARAETARGRLAITCTNPTIREPFEIVIDYDRGTVDSYPARVSETKISWYNPTNGRSYTLDRKSGALMGVFPSSTGGVIFHDRCKLGN
jgi:hypothetical protein